MSLYEPGLGIHCESIMRDDVLAFRNVDLRAG